MDPEPSGETTTVPSVPVVPITASKRKRGRPRKVQSSAMMMFESSVGLDEIRGVLGQTKEPPVVAIDPAEDAGTPTNEDTDDPGVPEPEPVPLAIPVTSPTPIVKKRGRPRKHPLPNPDDPPKIKRKRGRPPKAKPPPSEETVATETDTVDENGTHAAVSAVMYVPPPEVVPEPTQVRIAQVPVSDGDTEGEVASAKPQEVPSLEKPAKKKLGRPRKNPLPDANAPKLPRGRPKKTPVSADAEIKNPGSGDASDALPTSEAVSPVKRGRGRPRKNPLPTSPVEKKARGRPRKNPDGKRGRPKKSSPTTAEQSSEFAVVSLPSKTTSEIKNSSDQKKSETEEFNLMMSSDSDNDGFTVDNTVEMLKKHSKDTSPLLDDRFVESSDEDD